MCFKNSQQKSLISPYYPYSNYKIILVKFLSSFLKEFKIKSKYNKIKGLRI